MIKDFKILYDCGLDIIKERESYERKEVKQE